MGELSTLSERIAEKVGKELVDLIPQDEWKKLIDSEMKKFMRVNAPNVIREMIEKEFRVAVAKELDTLTKKTEWNQLTQQSTNDALVELIKASGADILAGILSPVMQQVLSDFRHRLGY